MTRKVAAAVILASVTCGAAPSEAQLERAGPIAPTHGYPAWYQDKSGLALEFCQPSTPAELADGWCLLLPGDTSVPESFPAQFGDEHFYWAAQAAVDFTAAGVSGKVLLVLALEAAFAQGSPAAGDQIVFGRVRVNMRQVPYGGTYTIYHPYGVEVFPDMAAGDRLFFTEDIGFGCADGFECALLSRLGPFLLPADTPGGAELGAVAGPVPGKLYIAAPTRLGPVTGSPVGQNFFRVEGPNGFALQTNDFSLMGRVYNGAIPGKVIVDRVAYSSTDSVRKLDVFATAYPTAQSRLPAAPKPPAIMPVLAFYPEACVQTTSGALTEPPGVEGIQMVNAGSVFWGQDQPQTIPRAVCVEDYTARDITGQVVPIFVEAPVTDQVTITEAVYDPSLGTLSVKAVSSDSLQSPPLSVATFGAMQSGLLLATSVVAPPSKVHVISAAGGQAELAVSTGVGGPGAAGGVPLAANDEIALVEDSGPTSIPVLANDTLQGVPIQAGPNVSVVIVGPPRLGTAVVEADGSITFTPTPDANGLEGIAYIVSANGVSSPAAYITIIISPVNDAPVAVADAAQAVAGRSETINVLANDTDIDGQGDVASVVIKTQPTGASAAIGADGLVTFSAPAAGTYTFTYAALDLAGAESAAAAVTVSVVASEVLTIVRSEYIRTTFRWRVEGTDNVLAGQRVTITYDNGTFLDGSSALNTVIGTAVVDALGAWSLDLRLTSAADLRNPTATNTFSARPTRVRATSSLGATATASIVLR